MPLKKDEGTIKRQDARYWFDANCAAAALMRDVTTFPDWARREKWIGKILWKKREEENAEMQLTDDFI